MGEDEKLEYFIANCSGIKWKERFVNHLFTVNNEHLFQETIRYQMPDDWDGIYTTKGEWRAKISLEILEYKLVLIGWLPEVH